SRRLERSTAGPLRQMAVNLHFKAVRKLTRESDAWRIASEPSISLQPDATDKMRLNFVRRTKSVKNIPLIAHRHSACRDHVAEKQPASGHPRTSVIAHFRCCASCFG